MVQPRLPQRSANLLFTDELTRRLEVTGVTANVPHRGVGRTSFGRDSPTRLAKTPARVAEPLMKTHDQGADTAVYLASSQKVEGVTGAHFTNRKRARVLPVLLVPGGWVAGHGVRRSAELR